MHHATGRSTQEKTRPRAVPALTGPLQESEHRSRRAITEPLFHRLQLGRRYRFVDHPPPHGAVVEVDAHTITEIGTPCGFVEGVVEGSINRGDLSDYSYRASGHSVSDSSRRRSSSRGVCSHVKPRSVRPKCP